MSDPTADETDDFAEILADPDRDADILNSDPSDGDQGDSAESVPPATSASPTSASPVPVDETEDPTDNADNADAQPAEVSAPASEPAAPALTPSPSEEQGPSLNTAQHTADATPPFISQEITSPVHNPGTRHSVGNARIVNRSRGSKRSELSACPQQVTCGNVAFVTRLCE